jgi:hypothetical protein
VAEGQQGNSLFIGNAILTASLEQTLSKAGAFLVHGQSGPAQESDMAVAHGTWGGHGGQRGGAKRKLASGIAAVSLLAAQSATAEPLSSAQKLRRLDIMLMVTGLRCRSGPDNFQADFQEFEARHLSELNAAAATMRGELSREYGAAGSARALDRVSVQMANQYGNGHPWLGCHELKMATQQLAGETDRNALLAAADQLLNGDGARDSSPKLAYDSG